MGSRRDMTIGITINLDNYENIRLDVREEIGSDEEADDLIRFMDSLLSRIGRDDPATAERVDHYRRRVFGSFHPPEGHVVPLATCPVTGSDDLHEEAPGSDLSGDDYPDPIPMEADADLKGVSEPEGDLVASTEEEPPVDAMSPEVLSPEMAEPDVGSIAPEVTPKEPQTGGPVYTCEACGVEVNKVQHDVSHLFMNRTLCKKCMNQS